MLIAEDLVFQDTRVVSLTSYPGDQSPKCILILAASLMPLHAEALGCAYVYKDGVPVADLDSAAIDGRLQDMELLLPSSVDLADSDSYFPDLISKFKVKRVADAKYEVSFRVHESTRRADLESLLTAINKDLFTIALKPRQGTLFEGGTRVDLADRSYENKSVKRGRGRPKKVQPVAEDGPRVIVEIDEPMVIDGDLEDSEALDILDEVIA